ncbi:MAG: hypothetical protein NTZ46_03460 [Verrucomicrobia bacterium]|nr:hypothetical protein [Verrucomicrobiota bacterium]
MDRFKLRPMRPIHRNQDGANRKNGQENPAQKSSGFPAKYRRLSF